MESSKSFPPHETAPEEQEKIIQKVRQIVETINPNLEVGMIRGNVKDLAGQPQGEQEHILISSKTNPDFGWAVLMTPGHSEEKMRKMYQDELEQYAHKKR